MRDNKIHSTVRFVVGDGQQWGMPYCLLTDFYSRVQIRDRQNVASRIQTLALRFPSVFMKMDFLTSKKTRAHTHKLRIKNEYFKSWSLIFMWMARTHISGSGIAEERWKNKQEKRERCLQSERFDRCSHFVWVFPFHHSFHFQIETRSVVPIHWCVGASTWIRNMHG